MRFSTCATRRVALGLLTLGVGSALAVEPMEEAKRLLAEKQYDAVDTALKKELTQRRPSVEALKLSLDAALASGRLVTAHQRITTLIQVTRNEDLELVFQGGEIADRVGDTRLALSRYDLYARGVAAKSERLETALLYLLRNGNYPEAYKRFVALYGAKRSAWRFGYELMGRLLEEADAENALSVAGELLKQYPATADVDAVHTRLREAADRFLLGQSREDRYLRTLRVMLVGVPSRANEYHLHHVFSQAEPAMAVDERLALTFKYQADSKNVPLSSTLFSRFNLMRELEGDDRKLEAGRKFLALEPIYRDSADAADYAAYVRTLLENPQVFAVKDKALTTPADLTARFEAVKAKSVDKVQDYLMYLLIQNYLVNDEAARTALLRKHLPDLSHRLFGLLQGPNPSATFAADVAAWCKDKGVRQIVDRKTYLLPLYNQLRLTNEVRAAAAQYLAVYPGSFDWRHARAHIAGSPVMSLDEKVAMLADVIGKGGASAPMKALFDDMATAEPWKAHEAFKNLKAALGKAPAGTDAVMALHVAIHLADPKNEKAIHELVRTYLKSRQGDIPGGREKCVTPSDVTLLDIFERHSALFWHSAKDVREVGLIWGPRLGLGSGLSALILRLREHNAGDTLFTLAPRLVALVKASNQNGDPADWRQMSSAAHPADDVTTPFAEVYGRMGWDNAVRYVYNQRTAWDRKRQHFNDEMAKIAAMPGFSLTDGWLLRAVIQQLFQCAGSGTSVAPALTATLWKALLADEQKSGVIDEVTEAYVYGMLVRSGHAAEAAAHLQQHLALIQLRPPEQRLPALHALVAQVGLPTEAAGVLTPGMAFHTALKVMRPLYDAVPRSERYGYPIHQTLNGWVSQVVLGQSWPEGEARTEARQLAIRLMDLLMDGATFHGHPPEMFGLMQSRCRELIDGKVWNDAARALSFFARIQRFEANWDANYAYRILPMAQKLEEAGANELAFIFIDAVQRSADPGDKVSKQLAILKSKAAQQMPNLVLVDPTDPTYDVQQAAVALAVGDEAKAWTLTSPKLKLLPKVWESLDQKYVAWCLDQMRKQKLLEPALELAFTILLRESDLDVDTAATVMLIKGDIYRDMENYQAARIEYQSLMDNRRYRNTDGWRDAQHRLIDLLILVRDYASAEAMIERLVDADDVRTQAEAYYRYAKMSFDQGQYKEAKEYLRQVKERVVTHVEAAFLEGELNLKLPGGLQYTEVPVGNARLSVVAIPGRDLTLKLQDFNLGVARAKSAIPVVVKTSKGGDEEHVKLLPSPVNRNLFTGVIATSLGQAQPGNLRLELTGDDVVSYMIEPEFQKANNIDYPAKTLEVRSNARLVASSGEILSEEEEAQREMQRRLLQQSAVNQRDQFYFRDPRTIRPGNRIHVQVRDFDRDVSGAADTVAVSLRTTAGDIVDRFPLVETGPYTGIFLGAIPTGVPFPKATASDTSEGKDPSSMINTGKPEAWVSLADGKKHKWVEVDTMSSHEVQSTYLEMPDPAQLKKVVLMGLLSEDYQVLAHFPEDGAGEGTGLKAEYFRDTEFKEPAEQRTDPFVGFNWRTGSPRPAGVESVLSARWSGQVEPRHSETYTFHVYADDAVRLTVNGKVLIDRWRANAHAEESGGVDLEFGKKADLLLEYYDRNGDGAVYLYWSSPSQKKELVPQRVLFPAAAAAAAAAPAPAPAAAAATPAVPAAPAAAPAPAPAQAATVAAPAEPAELGGMRVDVAPEQNGETAERITKYLSVAPVVSFRQPTTGYDRRRTPWPHQSWHTVQLRGSFFLAENRTLELRFGQPTSPGNWQYAHLFIDGEPILGGVVNADTVQRSRRVQLTQGPHDLKILMRDHWGESQVKVQYRMDDGNFADLPDDWFSTVKHPELAEHLKPTGKISIEAKRVVGELLTPKRLRRLRWVFDDFTGNGLTVQAFGIVNSEGVTVTPSADDFTSATTNATLEVAAGEKITITYEDEKRLREETPILTEELNSQYFNGSVQLANEEFHLDVNEQRVVEYQPSKRCRRGDQLVVLVEDYDADATDGRDTVEVTVTTSSGESLTLKALETMPNRSEEWHAHAGRFLAVLKLGEQTGKDTIAVKPGDVITASYMDKENTKPGIPVARTYAVHEGGQSKPAFIVYRTRVVMEADKSPAAETKLSRLRRTHPDAVILKERAIARHPEYRARGEEGASAPGTNAPVVDVNAPLLFELAYPKMALHAGSRVKVMAVADSEVQAARKAGREPTAVEAAVHVLSIEDLARIKGYPIRLESHQRRGGDDMLRDGLFAGVIRLQIGSPGDVVDDLVMAEEKEFVSEQDRKGYQDDLHFRVPTLLVAGSDIVHLTLKDEDTGEEFRQDMALRSNARLEVLDRSFTVRNASIYLGDNLYVQVKDPDRDVTDAQDQISVTVTSACGDRVTLPLSETLAHSGVFTGTLLPEFVGEAVNGQTPAPDTTDNVLRVNFGDGVGITYVDPLPLEGTAPLEMTETARIHFGSDAEMASFSKSFKDPEMAVKTRFLMAEALFEMAKQTRKLGQEDRASESIATGKQILEEAMYDYPDTSLAAQGEFLLANLAEELESYQEAIGRYSHVIRTWPESEYAERSQFKKALCLEKMENFDQACEEYVRLTYVYPESSLVGDATVRLASYYYKQQAYSVAGKIFENFQRRNPAHRLAAQALFLAAECHMRMQDYVNAIRAFESQIEQYDDPKDLRAQAMYWLGDCYFRQLDYTKAYQTFKKVTWDYPESKWAKIARGRLTSGEMIKEEEKGRDF